MAVAVALADLTVAAVDEQLALLTLRDLPRLLDRLSLRRHDGRRALVSFRDDGPLTVPRDHVLVLAFGHRFLEMVELFTAQTDCNGGPRHQTCHLDEFCQPSHDGVVATDLSALTSNLKRLRVARGMSQGDVADAAELSRVGYRNIENGVAAPRIDSLLRVARALDVKLEELFVPVRELRAVRFRASKKMTTRGELLADVARWLDDYNELEEVLGEKVPFGLGSLCADVRNLRGSDRPQAAALLARAALGLGEFSEVRDLCGLLEAKGVKVFTPKLASEGFFGLSVAPSDGGPAVVVNVWERLSVERWIFTAAHELGHLLLHLDAYDVSQTEEDAAQEKEADVFAATLLMPPQAFARKLEESRGLPLVRLVFKLKRAFGVSWKTVLYRLSSTTADGGRLWGRFQAEYRAIAGHTIGPTEEPEAMAASVFRPPPKVADEPEHLLEDDFVEGRLELLVRRAVESDAISMSRAAEILRVDVTTMRSIANSWVG